MGNTHYIVGEIVWKSRRRLFLEKLLVLGWLGYVLVVAAYFFPKQIAELVVLMKW